MNKITGRYKIAVAWCLLFMYPILAIGYVVVAFGIAIKIFGYILKFDFERVWDEIRETNENFKL